MCVALLPEDRDGALEARAKERERANVVVREGTSDLRGRFCCEMQERNER